MKFLAIFLVALIVACVQAQDVSGRSNTLPEHLVGGAKAALANSPGATTPLKVQQAIQNPSENVADVLSRFDPANAYLYKKYAGFDIPINREVFVALLKQAYSRGRLDKLTIVTIVAASIKIPPAGDLKRVALYLVKEFLCRIANSGLLPGIENNIAFILKTIEDNNRLEDGITKSVVNIADNIPLIGSLLKHVGNTIAGSVPGISELIRIFADNPARGVNAMIAYVHKQGPITSTCPAPRQSPPAGPVGPVAQTPISIGAPSLPIEQQRPLGPAPDAPVIGPPPF